MISGHRRRYASILAGKKEIPAIVREMDDDTATILMVDSNLQREHILPSERAKAYKMKMEKKGEDNYDHNEDYWKCISSGSTACTVTGADCINHAYLYDEFCGGGVFDFIFGLIGGFIILAGLSCLFMSPVEWPLVIEAMVAGMVIGSFPRMIRYFGETVLIGLKGFLAKI